MANDVRHSGLLRHGHHLRPEDQPLHQHRGHGQPIGHQGQFQKLKIMFYITKNRQTGCFISCNNNNNLKDQHRGHGQPIGHQGELQQHQRQQQRQQQQQITFSALNK